MLRFVAERGGRGRRRLPGPADRIPDDLPGY